ncbi:MAG: type II secretion system protein GspG [Rhizobiales bacterium]|nr:type II secretion system protein GspG [Hyphomicrobiales bacterium]
MRKLAGAAKARRMLLTGSPGFTLIEMLVVLVIIGLIMGLVGPQVLNYLTNARTKAARLQIEAFGSALDLYYLDVGRYPPASEGLNALVRRPSGTEVWNGPYLKGGAVPPDPWGNAYAYRAPAERAPYEIISMGADGNEGGTGSAADIRSGAR